VGAEDPSADSSRLERSETSRIGRRLGVVLFWVSCSYLIGMSARSIIPALYFPDAAPRPSAFAVQRCAAELDTLQHQLSEAASSCLRRGRLANWDAKLATWDARFGALGNCGPYEPARKDLLVLRTELDELVQDYGRGALKTQQRLRSALAAFASPDAT
jgi:hypothetical protein